MYAVKPITIAEEAPDYKKICILLETWASCFAMWASNFSLVTSLNGLVTSVSSDTSIWIWI